MSTSSARPIDLFFYADTSERLNALLRNEAAHLHILLDEFQRTCTEYGRVVDGDLDGSLRTLTDLHDARATWVREVAWDFTKDKAGALVDNVGVGLTSLFQFGVQVESQIGSATNNLGRQIESLQEDIGHTANDLFETGQGWLRDTGDFGKGVISDAAEGVSYATDYINSQVDKLVVFIEGRINDAEQQFYELQQQVANSFKMLQQAISSTTTTVMLNIENFITVVRSGESNLRNNWRFEEDERWKRPFGGTRNGDYLDYDWAGGEILERYLTGGGDWYIKDDSHWTTYMQKNSFLTEELKNRSRKTAQALLKSKLQESTIKESFPMEIENGEGIVGYQYLHGTNANAGDFQRDGTASLKVEANGDHLVTMKMKYTWNDIIDPNPIYETDKFKNSFAEIITLGKADPYEIHISWSETTEVRFDKDGNLVSISNI